MANVNEIPTQVRDAVRKGQEALTETVKSWSETITERMPDVTIPGADKALPRAKSVVNTAFDFAEQAVSKQRELVVGALDTVEARVAREGQTKRSRSSKGSESQRASSA